jgi:hypothetical protein
MRKKVQLLLFSISALALISIFLIIYLFINQNTIINFNKKNNKNISFFSGHIFNKNIVVVTDKYNLFKIRLLDNGSKLLNPPEIVTFKNEQWIVLMHKNSISLYSKSRDKIYHFSLQDKNIVSGCISTLNDNTFNLLLLIAEKKSKFAEDLLVVPITETKDNIEFKIQYTKTLKNLNPWKIQTCDVDGDGKKEISIGMYKTTPFDPVMAKRPFIYQWTQNKITPKWLGSRLSKPFQDYIFADINQDGKDELISIELLQNSHKIVTAYAWKEFGFEAIGNSDEFIDIKNISKGANVKDIGYNIMVKAKLKHNITLYTLQYINGSLITKGNK